MRHVWVCPKIDFNAEKEVKVKSQKKLTKEEVEAGLQMYVSEQLTGMELARRLNISKSYVADLLTGKHWKEVLRPEGFQYPWPDARRRPHRDSKGVWIRLAKETST